MTTRRMGEAVGTDGVAVVAAVGELDLTTAPRLREVLVGLATSGERHAVADLSGLEFIDSIGLGVVVASVKRFRALGGELHVAVTTDRIRGPFELTGLTAAFTLHPSVEAAVASATAAAAA